MGFLEFVAIPSSKSCACIRYAAFTPMNGAQRPFDGNRTGRKRHSSGRQIVDHRRSRRIERHTVPLLIGTTAAAAESREAE